MSGYLLDTNIISEVIRPHPEPRVVAFVAGTDEALLHLSVLTLGEIRNGIVGLQNASRRALLDAWVDRDLLLRFAGRILAIDQHVADRWGRITANSAQEGVSLPVIDGLLAATALQHNLTLVTRNTKHVSSTGVSVINPWSS